MATVTINGTELSTDDPKVIRRELAKAKREEKLRETQRKADRDSAQLKAESNAYRILQRKALGEQQVWEYATPHSRYGKHIVKVLERDSVHRSRVYVQTDPEITLDFYGHDVIGVLHGCGGWVLAVFVVDNTTRQVVCYGIGVTGDQWALADCPGITLDDFNHDELD